MLNYAVVYAAAVAAAVAVLAAGGIVALDYVTRDTVAQHQQAYETRQLNALIASLPPLINAERSDKADADNSSGGSNGGGGNGGDKGGNDSNSGGGGGGGDKGGDGGDVAPALMTAVTAIAPIAAITLNIALPSTYLHALYPLVRQGALHALIVRASALDGYNGALTLLFAYVPPFEENTPARIRVIHHKETPGITAFLTSEENIRADGVSGATITTAAIAASEREIRRQLNRLRRIAEGAAKRPAERPAENQSTQ